MITRRTADKLQTGYRRSYIRATYEATDKLQTGYRRAEDEATADGLQMGYRRRYRRIAEGGYRRRADGATDE
jgi:hypothetical protein